MEKIILIILLCLPVSVFGLQIQLDYLGPHSYFSTVENIFNTIPFSARISYKYDDGARNKSGHENEGDIAGDSIYTCQSYTIPELEIDMPPNFGQV